MNRIASCAAFVLLAASSLLAQQAKNVKILTGLTPLQLQREMNVMRAALGVHCDYCHVGPTEANGNKWDFASDANPKKETGRRMLTMMTDLNKTSFEGQPIITCYTCHNGQIKPRTSVPLPQPQPPFPTPVEDRTSYPAAKVLVAKYVAAIGGEKALPLLHPKSRTSAGTRVDTKGNNTTFERRETKDRTYVKAKTGDVTVEQSFGGDGGWIRDKSETRDMRPGELEAVRDVYPSFEPFDPATLNDKARVIAKEKIGDRDAWVVSDKLDDNTRVQVWFDANSGFVLRRLMLVNSQVGRIPKQTDYDDYRDAGGIKLPHEVKFSSVDPWIGSTLKYTEIHPGAPVDPAVFAK